MDSLITTEEIRRIREISIELLETLAVTLQTITDYAKKHNIALPRNLPFLLQRTINLIQELDAPPNFQQRFRTPPDSTEPRRIGEAD
jgi:hypothetical protein